MKVKTQSKKVNKAWLNDHVNDTYVKLAAKEGFRARAAYKLKEIDEQFGLISPGQLVVDLGCTPGAWSQYLRRKMSPGGAAAGALNGCIIGVDLLAMEPVEGVLFLQGDFREAEVLALYASGETADRVARQLFITRQTVLDHIRRIRARYAAVDRPAHTKLDLYHRAVEDGIVPPKG